MIRPSESNHKPEKPPGFPDDQRAACWIAFGSTCSTAHLDHLWDWGFDLLESEDAKDRLFGGSILRVVRLERQLRDLTGDTPAEA